MSLIHIGDDEKVEGARNARDLMNTHGEPLPQPAMVDAGTHYGWRRQAGDTHALAINGMRIEIGSWYGGPPANDMRLRRHIGDDEKVRLADVAVPIILSHEATDLDASLFDLGCQFAQVVQDTGSLDRAFAHVGGVLAMWYGVERPFPEAQEPGGPGPIRDAKFLVVHGSRRWLSEEGSGQPADIREVMGFGEAGMALQEGHDSIRPTAALVSSLGFNCVQVLTTLDGQPGDYWYTRRLGPNHPGSLEALDATVAINAEHGMRTRLVIFGGLDNFGGRWDPQARRDEFSGEIRARAEQWALLIADRYKDNPWVILSLANEPDQIGFRDSFDKLVELGRRVKQAAPRLPLALGGHTREGDTVFLRAPGDYNDVHLQRIEFNTPQGREFWPTIKRSGENPNIDQHVMPFWHGEPPNYGNPPQDFGRPGRSDIDGSMASAFCAAATARSRQYTQTFHCDSGLFWNNPPPLTVDCMRAYHRGLNAFPMTAGGTLWRGHWNESFFDKSIYPGGDDERTVLAHVHGNRGPWRVFGVGNYAVTILEPADFDMPRHATAPVEVVDRVVHGRYASGVYRRI